jgi:DNA-binding transcriptional MerR regulator
MEQNKSGGYPKMENFMGRSATARELGASESAVNLWARSGKLPSVKTTDGRRLFRQGDVEAFKAKLRVRKGATTSAD